MATNRIVALVACLGGVTGLVGCLARGGSPPAVGDARATMVRTVPIDGTQYSAPVVATGVLSAAAELPLAFKLGGVVARIAVVEGQSVAAGAVLAEIDLGEIDAGVAKAEAGLDKATRDHRRAETLYRDSVISKERLDDAATALAVAAAEAKAVRFNRRHAVIRAPSSGTVLGRLAEPGQTVGPGAPILLFGAAGQGAVVKVALADRDVARLSLGDPAEVQFDAAPGQHFAGVVSRIGAMATAGSGTYQVEIRLDGPAPWTGRVASGWVATATLRPRRSRPATLLPLEALLEADGDSATVFVLNGDRTTVSRRTVRIAGIEGTRAVITGGLDGAAEVVTEGAAFLRSGDAVRVVADR